MASINVIMMSWEDNSSENPQQNLLGSQLSFQDSHWRMENIPNIM